MGGEPRCGLWICDGPQALRCLDPGLNRCNQCQGLWVARYAADGGFLVRREENGGVWEAVDNCLGKPWCRPLWMVRGGADGGLQVRNDEDGGIWAVANDCLDLSSAQANSALESLNISAVKPDDPCLACGKVVCQVAPPVAGDLCPLRHTFDCLEPGSNACGGCGELISMGGSSSPEQKKALGACTVLIDESDGGSLSGQQGTWLCSADGKALICEPHLVQNTCGGQDPLIAEPGTPCPGCGSWQCGDGGVACIQGSRVFPETCNGIDDDCNGGIDRGADGGILRRPCNISCQGVTGGYTGVQACIAGNWNECSMTFPQETCDPEGAVDNDCDGFVDEGDSNCEDAFEPAMVTNNSCGEATYVFDLKLAPGSNSSLEGTLVHGNTTDWYKIQLKDDDNQADTLQIKVELLDPIRPENTNYRLCIRRKYCFYTATDQCVSEVDGNTKQLVYQKDMSIHLNDAEDLFVEVKSVNGNSCCPYKIDVKVEDAN